MIDVHFCSDKYKLIFKVAENKKQKGYGLLLMDACFKKFGLIPSIHCKIREELILLLSGN